MLERIGKYTLAGVLGSGATGTVYLARDPDLDRKVAVKQLATALLTAPGFMEGFRAEAEIMARLDHPNCVHVYDYFEDESGAYIVSEYVAGASLRRLLADNGHLGPEQSLGVTRGALLGLAYAHERGLVHRDVKPENLLADVEGNSKLADFGQAFFAGEARGGENHSTGSPAYMSPEQVRGEQGDVRSDVYAAGAVLYEFLAGRPPFIALSPLAVMKMHLEREPPDINRVNPRVPAEVGRVIIVALSKDPAYRYSSAGEFLAVLEEVARDTYGPGWLMAGSIAGLVGAATAGVAAAATAASPVAGATQVGGTAVGRVDAAAEPAPQPEPQPAPEPRAAPTPAPGRPAALLAGIAVLTGLVVGGALGTLSPLPGSHRSLLVVPGSPAPSSTPAVPVVTSINAHFDDASSTTFYRLEAAVAGATFKWGWLRKPPCGTLRADPDGRIAAYTHNGCNPVTEAQAMVGVCASVAGKSALYQRNARFGDGALTPNDAAAAGVAADQFSRVEGAAVPASCDVAFIDATSATITALASPGATVAATVPSSVSPSAPTIGATASPPDGSANVLPAAAAAAAGMLLALAGLLMLRRPPGSQ